jgi:hypothetical protein
MNEEEIREGVEKTRIGEAVIKRVYDDLFRFGVCMNLTDLDLEETDYSTLSVKEVIDKIRAFLAQKPKDVSEMIFLHYMAKYPVSMCKRDVSPCLRTLIGFHYRLGVPDKEQQESGAEKVSYDDLSEIFVRSKATISECVNQTESKWKEVQWKAEQEQKLEEEARRQLIEEKKQKLREMEQNSQTDEQTSERTPITPEREDNSA